MGLACVVALFAALRPRTFPTGENFQFILTQTAVVATAALGIGSHHHLRRHRPVGGLGAGGVHRDRRDLLQRSFPPAVAGLLTVALGGAVGLSIGVLVTYGRLLPFIVTLGMLGALRGTAELLGARTTASMPPRLGSTKSSTSSVSTISSSPPASG